MRMTDVRWLVMLMLVGCATVPPPAVEVPPLPVEVPAEVVAPSAPSLPAEDRAHLLSSEPHWVEGPPLQVSVKAAKLARMAPSLGGFDHGMLVYPYRPYAVYGPLLISVHGGLHVQLQPGEVIRLVGPPPESEWKVDRDDATTMRESSHLFIFPKGEPPMEGRLTLITSCCTYYLDLKSHEASGIYGVSWRHPGMAAR